MNAPETNGHSGPLLMRLHSANPNRIELLAIAAPSPDNAIAPEALKRQLQAHHPKAGDLVFEEAAEEGTLLRWQAKSWVANSGGSLRKEGGLRLLRFTEENRLWALIAAPGWLCLAGVAVYIWMMLAQREPAALFAVIILSAFALLFFRQREKLQAKKVEAWRKFLADLTADSHAKSHEAG